MRLSVQSLDAAIDHLRQKSLVRKLHGTALVCGDIHGDLDALDKAIAIRDQKGADYLVLLGDYVDRGPQQGEVVAKICEVLESDEKLIPLRGNHEDPSVFDRYGFGKVIRNDNLPRKEITELFSHLPLVGHSSDVFMCHGGIPVEKPFDINQIKDWERNIRIPHGLEYQLLWNDPIFEQHKVDYRRSPRGGCYEFGSTITANFLQDNNLDLIIRAHTYLPEGWRWAHENNLLSLFSSRGGPYMKVNRTVAFLDVDDATTCELIFLD